jgi:hypothetical protein
MRQQHAKDGFFQLVDLVIGGTDGTAKLAVGAHERAQGIAKHLAGALRHDRDLRRWTHDPPRLSGADQAQRRLGDVHGVIADPLEIAGDLDRADDEPKIARHRLLKSEERHGEVFDLDLELVDLVIRLEHRLGESLVALEQRVDGQIEQCFCFLGHVEQPLLEEVELLVKMPEPNRCVGRAHPNLPVMYASVRASRGLVNSRFVSPSSIRRPT